MDLGQGLSNKVSSQQAHDGHQSRSQPVSARSWLEWGLLTSGLLLLTITEQYRSFVWVGLVLVILSSAVRVWRKGRLLPNTGMEIPWVLFLGSGALATYISYDRPAAFLMFCRFVAAAVWFYALVDTRTTLRLWNAWGLVILATLLAVYWPLQHDFSAQPAKFSILTAIGLWLNAHLPSLRLESITGPAIHPNIAGAALSLATPFAFMVVIQERQRGRAWAAALSILALGLILFGLLLSGSRGAWLGVAVSAGLGGLLWMQRRWFADPAALRRFWAAVLGSGLAGAFLLLTVVGPDRLAGQIPDPGGSLRSRTVVWAEGMILIRDYFFTGIGLQAFRLVNPLYVMLIHSPYLPHAHNTFLEVWIEQGALGALGLIWAVVVWLGWFWKAVNNRKPALRSMLVPYAWAGLAALVISLVHGMVDVIFTFTRLMPLAGLVLGFAWLGTQSVQVIPANRPAELQSVSALRRFWPALAGLSLLAVVWWGKPLYNQVASAWYANLGALNQSLLELSRYDPAHFDRPTLDRIRQELDLRAVEAAFAQALRYNPHNLTARQRLTQIALSRGEYAAAEATIGKAWHHGELDTVTRLLYGDALTAQGKTAQAAAVIRGLTWARGRLLFQAFYRYWVSQDFVRSVLACDTVLRLNPDDQTAADLLAQARAKLAAP